MAPSIGRGSVRVSRGRFGRDRSVRARQGAARPAGSPPSNPGRGRRDRHGGTAREGNETRRRGGAPGRPRDALGRLLQPPQARRGDDPAAHPDRGPHRDRRGRPAGGGAGPRHGAAAGRGDLAPPARPGLPQQRRALHARRLGRAQGRRRPLRHLPRRRHGRAPRPRPRGPGPARDRRGDGLLRGGGHRRPRLQGAEPGRSGRGLAALRGRGAGAPEPRRRPALDAAPLARLRPGPPGALAALHRPCLHDLLPPGPHAGLGRHHRPGLPARPGRRRGRTAVPARPPRPDAGGRLARRGRACSTLPGIC